jgi:tRNA G37 N-methylase Trm5
MLEFSDKKIVGEVLITQQISESDIENIIVTCFEGGSSYWLGLTANEDFKDKPKDEPLATWATKLLLEGKTIHLYESVDDNEKWELTLEKLLKGITQNAKERPWDCDLDNCDADTTDCIIQYALFNEVVYG